MIADQEWLGLADTAHALGVPWSSAYRYALSGRLTAMRRGRFWYCKRDSIELLADELRQLTARYTEEHSPMTDDERKQPVDEAIDNGSVVEP